jgi:hypothetical protein
VRTLTSERALVSSAKAERGESWRECCTKLHDCENKEKNLLAQEDDAFRIRCGIHTACFDHIQSSSKNKSSDYIATLSMLIAPFACSTYPTYPISPTDAAWQSRGWQRRAVSFSSRKREISENSSRVTIKKCI